jgi:hypothetical protein
MLRRFEVGFESHRIATSGITAIEVNLKAKLSQLKYISYRKIYITLIENTSKNERGIIWDDGKDAHINLNVDTEILSNLSDIENVKFMYRLLLNTLEPIWLKNNWDAEDLIAIYNTIESEKFEVEVRLGKEIVSPDRKTKAVIICKLYPDYADYFIGFKKANRTVCKILYLKGHPVPGLFFDTFVRRYWKDNDMFILNDANKEIYFLFSVSRCSFEIEYLPKINSMEDCQNQLKGFEAGLSQEERLKLWKL